MYRGVVQVWNTVEFFSFFLIEIQVTWYQFQIESSEFIYSFFIIFLKYFLNFFFKKLNLKIPPKMQSKSTPF